MVTSNLIRHCLRKRRFILNSRRMSSSVSAGCHERIMDIYEAAVNSVKPLEMVKNNLKLSPEGSILQICEGRFPKEISIDGKRIYVVAYGKAVIGMVTALDSILGNRIEGGIASIPTNTIQELKEHGRSELIPKNTKVALCEGAHMNIPDEACVRTSQDIMKLVTDLTKDDVLITLTSGGGSALLTTPIEPLTISDLVSTTKSLAKAGANIIELNTVRKHLEILKGGGLVKLAHPAQVINLVLSDIVGDPLDCIASGPTVHDQSTSQNAIQVINKYLSKDQIPPIVMDLLATDAKASRTLLFYDKGLGFPTHYVQNVIIGSNSVALAAAAHKCTEMNIIPVVVTSSLCGSASQVGRDMVTLAERLRNKESEDLLEGLFTESGPISCQALVEAMAKSRETKQPVCLLFGGETTVEVKGSGKGGRNQEMCLTALMEMSSLQAPAGSISFASIGTDGQDGPTDAAGAIVRAESLSDNSKDNCPQAALENNDSYTFFTKLNGGTNLVKTGLTGTNVMDISILLLADL